ncbi:hypothetical protein [Actinoplanes derwentensis]|uniref:Uncharacterized protein n=1 Tax=Actinoplanes derwentensis TaxID=113562 RepID=A0A1H1QX85_9ACTN|nr:hypothetical protein [Actinoplanes derwentensis]GID87087.1 hypothetical protein Ade03nite_60110 [Actinoplanes derwentensis]SDS27905.1 hypothetical protein SAMN04489716_0427 [Actinoplanes derwentensis]
MYVTVRCCPLPLFCSRFPLAPPGFIRPGAAALAPSTDVAGIAAGPEPKDLEGLVARFGGVCGGVGGGLPGGITTTVGDGWYLFQFIGKGCMYHGEGSGYDCKGLGIEGSAPFCIS